MAPNLFMVVCVFSPVVLRYLDAGFRTRCPRKGPFTRLSLLLAYWMLADYAVCCSSLDPRRGVKP